MYVCLRALARPAINNHFASPATVKWSGGAAVLPQQRGTNKKVSGSLFGVHTTYLVLATSFLRVSTS